MTNNNEILGRIMDNESNNDSSRNNIASSTPKEEPMSQVRIVTARYKVYAAIIIALGLLLGFEWYPKLVKKYDNAVALKTSIESRIQELESTNKKLTADNVLMETILANESTLESCLNDENVSACASLPQEWEKDLSIPLSYSQLHSLFNPKMPIDEKKVLRNLNEYLIQMEFSTGTNKRNGTIDSINIGDPISVNNSSVFFSVPVNLTIEFETVKDLISFVHNVERKLISIPEDRILYKIQEISYDIVTSSEPQTSDISMIAYYYHDPRFKDIEIDAVEESDLENEINNDNVES